MRTKKKVVALVLALFMLWPTLALATVWTNITITVNGKALTYQVPIQTSAGSRGYNTNLTLRLVKEGDRWLVYESRPGVRPPTLTDGEKPKLPKPEKPTPPKEEKPTPPQEGFQLTPDEAKMLDLVNQERENAGLTALKLDPKLTQLAREKSKDMVDNDYFSHTSPTLGTPFDMMKAAGIAYKYAGENLAGAAKVKAAHQNLMDSPGHRANILNSNFDHIGIGIVEGSPYGKIYTQMFIEKK